MGDLVLETAHRDPLAADLRVVQKPEREISTWPPTQPATSGWRVAMRHWSCRYSQVSGRPRLRRRRMPPPMNTPQATPRTIESAPCREAVCHDGSNPVVGGSFNKNISH